MDDLIARAIDAATGSGRAYADVRVVEHEAESLTVKNGSLAAASSDRSSGFGVRALVDGAWGFASSRDLDLAEAERSPVEPWPSPAPAAWRAVRRSCSTTRRRSDGAWATPVAEDPFGVRSRRSSASCSRPTRPWPAPRACPCARRPWRPPAIASTSPRVRGARDPGPGLVRAAMSATAVNEHESQERSYPKSLGGQVVGGGFEAIREMDLAGHGQRIGEEAVALLDAPQCPSGRWTSSSRPRRSRSRSTSRAGIRPSSTACWAWKPPSPAPAS